jgi:hypothetical protein
MATLLGAAQAPGIMPDMLTEHELEVLQLLAADHFDQAIAQ